MLGETQRANDYLLWARVIKREILTNFWPSTSPDSRHGFSFAEQQYSIGDARYLIAQITPFDFSWKCDVFGNLLAFLHDVTDANLAGQTFRFLWGAGVSQPFPVANIYPVVTMGDKEWRDLLCCKSTKFAPPLSQWRYLAIGRWTLGSFFR